MYQYFNTHIFVPTIVVHVLVLQHSYILPTMVVYVSALQL